MITFQPESIGTIWEEIYPLAAQHAQESRGYRRDEPFLPSRDRYVRYADCGYYHIVTVRDGGRLVGYLGFYLAPSMHSQRLCLSGDSIYLAPSARGGRTAIRLLKYVERYVVQLAKSEYESMDLVLTVEPGLHRAIVRILERLDYIPAFVQYVKRLPLPTGANSTTTASAVGTYVETP